MKANKKAINEEIKALLVKGTSLKAIAKMFGITKYSLDKLIFKIWEPEKIESKDITLYSTSEDWLINGDKTTYKDLSKEEKLIYDKI